MGGGKGEGKGESVESVENVEGDCLGVWCGCGWWDVRVVALEADE